MENKRTVLLVSPQACRIGHGAYHGQQTLYAFAEIKEIETIFLTGSGFSERVDLRPNIGEIIEVECNFSTLGTHTGFFEDIRWGIKRSISQEKILRHVDKVLKSKNVNAVVFMGGDIGSIYRCWLRNKFIYPNVGWVAGHSMLDFYLENFSIRSIYKWLSSFMVTKMTNEMGATVLYVGEKQREEFCNRLRISPEACKRIVLAHFGSEPDDKRIPKAEARRKLGIPKNKKVALFFGLIREDKGPEIAINSIAKSSTDWLILLAGKPYDYSKEEIENWVIEKGLTNRSKIILKYIDENDIKFIFSSADVLLLPYTRPLVSSSGQLCLARSYRLPVISSNLGFLGETIRKERLGFIAESLDPNSFVEQLSNYSNLSHVQLKNIENCIAKSAHEHSFQSNVNTYIHAINLAISK